jgi:hypothetical protein
MLGEPGIGKSTEFAIEFDRVRREIALADGACLRFDLSEYQTDARLVADAFENEIIRVWQSGRHVLHLFLDSLDEGRLEIRNIANTIAAQVKRLGESATRLRLRITCRTAEWPISLEKALNDVWGDEGVTPIELVPLRRCDVAIAAEAEGVQADRFLFQVEQKYLEPFAINPVTLRFLLEIFRRSGDLPLTKLDIYEQGCRRLCEEASQRRRDAGHFGELSARQQLEIASRLAAISVFCGRSIFDLGAQNETNTDVISVGDLAGGTEQTDGNDFAVSDANVREVLSTPLISGRGPGLLGFAHRTYAEFLAARYVVRRNLDAMQLGSLLFHFRHDADVVPQLAETAAWIAGSNSDIRERTMRTDPQILLRSDVATMDDGARSSLIDSILAGLASGHVGDSDWSLRDHYRKLAHPNLPSQLEPVISDKAQKIVSRRFAIDLAEECRETALLSVLTQVAVDRSDNPHIRAQSAHAISKFGDEATLKRLIPLAVGDSGPDPDDELRGIALHAVWSRGLVSSDQLFASLIRPQRDSFFGEYRSFLNGPLTKHLHPNGLLPAINWCARQHRQDGAADEFRDAVATIIRLALSHTEEPGVIDALAEYVVARINERDELHPDRGAFSALGESPRRQIIAAVVGTLMDPTVAWFGLFALGPDLIHEDDFVWLLDQSANSLTEHEKRAWADLARLQFRSASERQLDKVLEYSTSNTIIEEAFSALIRPVELHSAAAAKLRELYAHNLQLDERARERREPPLLEPPPEIRVAACLDRFESGDLRGWWRLVQDLQLEPRSTDYQHELNDDLTQFPGWIAADEGRRRRILSAAKQYLLAWRSNPDEWIDTHTIYYPDFAGYRALVLVDKCEPAFLESLDAANWSNVAPTILAFPVSCGAGNGSEVRQRRLAKAAYARAPDEVMATLLKLLDRENANQSEHFFELRRVNDCLDDRMAAALLTKARDVSLKPSFIGDLLEELVSRKFCEAIGFAKALIGSSVDERTRAIAREAGVVLWTCADDRGWDVLWPAFRCDRAFFRDVITDVAHDRRQARWPRPQLSEDDQADLYVLLAQEFPREDDPSEEGAHFVGPRESVAHYRDNVLSGLCSRGTFAACEALERIRTAFPQAGFLESALRTARRRALEATWVPLSISQLLELTSRRPACLIRNARELQRLLHESLGRIQLRLHGETPAIRDLWDYNRTNGSWQPVDENALSDYVARHLRNDLDRSGIVALREVEIRRGNGRAGERTDIYVAVAINGPLPDAFNRMRVIVEVKGCWNPDLKTAMEAQLKERYLKANDCNHGVYVVGWFKCDSWDASDSRIGTTPKWTADDARAYFDEQAARISSEGACLSAVVLDLSLR